MKSFKFKLVKPKTVMTLWKTWWFAGGSLVGTINGDKLSLGQAGGVKWPDTPYVDAHVMRTIMKDIFGEPNQPAIDDAKMSFNYIFKSRKHKKIFFEIYDYYGHMSCGVGRPMTYIFSKEVVDSINNELRELIDELVIAYNLLKDD